MCYRVKANSFNKKVISRVAIIEQRVVIESVIEFERCDRVCYS